MGRRNEAIDSATPAVHDYMYKKILVCDDMVVTGSYNFSADAQRNAENQVGISDPALAGGYADHIATIAAAYPAGTAVRRG